MKKSIKTKFQYLSSVSLFVDCADISYLGWKDKMGNNKHYAPEQQIYLQIQPIFPLKHVLMTFEFKLEDKEEDQNGST